MKKILVAFFSIIVTFSFSGVVVAANNLTPCTSKITKQLILSEDEPVPAPEPAPEPEPAPAPEPDSN